jgi:hypothetical protein
MRGPHKRVFNVVQLSEATDKWAALYHKLKKQRGFTREYNDKQRQQAAHARKNALSNGIQERTLRGMTLNIDGKEYRFTHDASTHSPTKSTTLNDGMFCWTNPPCPTDLPHISASYSSKRRQRIQAKPLGLHTTFKKHVIRHTNQHTDGAVLDVVYADHAIPRAFLAEQWLAKRQQQLLTSWEPHIVMRNHLAMWAARGYTPKRINSVNYNTRDENITGKRWYGSGPAKRMVEVEWNDTWEPVQGCREYSNFQALYKIFQTTRNAPPKEWCPPSRQDMHLSKLARIGLGREPAVPPQVSACLRLFIRVATHPVNPDMDIKPVHKYTLLRTCHVHNDCRTEVCHSYNPSGRYLGTVTWDRLQQLFIRYNAANEVATLLDFEEQVGLLLIRYSASSLKNHWATPEQYLLAFATGLNAYPDMPPDMRELMASPLNVSKSTERYCSRYVEDAKFGAEHDAYSFPWVGLNECNPEYEHMEMDKAVRWAIGSIVKHPNIPTATLMVLPDWRGSATSYQRWLSHPLVHNILTIPRHTFQFQTPDFGKQEKLMLGIPNGTSRCC